MECTFDQIPSLKGWFWSGQEGPGQAVDKQSKREGEWKTCDRQKNIISLSYSFKIMTSIFNPGRNLPLISRLESETSTRH